MGYRYSYSQSQMQPPFWIIKDRQKHIAEVWDEEIAKLIVRALEAVWEPKRQEISRDITRRLVGG